MRFLRGPFSRFDYKITEGVKVNKVDKWNTPIRQLVEQALDERLALVSEVLTDCKENEELLKRTLNNLRSWSLSTANMRLVLAHTSEARMQLEDVADLLNENKTNLATARGLRFLKKICVYFLYTDNKALNKLKNAKEKGKLATKTFQAGFLNEILP